VHASHILDFHPMPVRFNHTIVFAKDRRAAARFFQEIFALAEPVDAGMFVTVRLADDVFLQFAEPGVDFVPQHYAFLVDDISFDGVVDRLQTRGIGHWADPRMQQTGINYNHGGRGVYFLDPNGHGLEAITRPYV
jgi:catechol 2,3-dioxygenase-like lactoylglutathione lyase family enzyme